jgi:excisionase family DNA binding protein
MQALLTKKEAAQMLNVSVSTIDRWMEARRIAYIKMPSGSIRFKVQHLENLLNKWEYKEKKIVA